MVTMQTRGEPSVQTYNLSLSSLVPESDREDPETAAKMSETGFLEVTVNYKTHIVKVFSHLPMEAVLVSIVALILQQLSTCHFSSQGETEVHPDAVSRVLPGATVCISVGVIRASGLKVRYLN